MSEANVITGYLGKPEDPKALVYRIGLVATSIPAMIIIAVGVDSYKALILSQVALSVQLPFTVIPLLLLVGSRKVMGKFASGWGEKVLGWTVALVVLALNALLLFQSLGGKF
jgi:manganese transport protein